MMDTAPAATRKCGTCHGTGTRFDPTCADNVYTHADAITVCQWCKGTGRQQVTAREPWTPPAGDPAYDGEPGEIPDWMLG